MKNFFINLTLSISAIIFSCLVLEILLRLFFPQPVNYYAIPKDPKPGSVHNTWGVRIKYNSLGFRDKEYSYKKKHGVVRIIAIGDSITFGFGIPLESTYHKKLEDILNRNRNKKKYEVLSINRGASNILWAINEYKKIGVNLKPDIVVLGLCLNDILDYSKFSYSEDGKKNKKNRTISKSIISALRHTHATLRRLSHLYFLIFERSRKIMYKYFVSIKTIHPDNWDIFMTDSPEFKTMIASTSNIIENFRNLVQGNGTRFIVAIFPYGIQLSDYHVKLYKEKYKLPEFTDAPKGIIQKKLTTELEKKSIEYIDLLYPFQTEIKKSKDTPLFFRDIGGMLDYVHPNEKGHLIIASELAKFLRSGK